MTALAASLLLLPVACAEDSAPPGGAATTAAAAQSGPSSRAPSRPGSRPSAQDGPRVGPRVGPRGDLPALFPAAEGSVGIGGTVTVQGATATLRGGTTRDGEVGDGDVRLVLDAGSSGGSAPVPAGWSPALLGQGLHTPDGVGLVVSQEGGDSDTWTVYAWRAPTLTPATVDAGVPLGGGFTSDGMHAYLSWLTPQGRLFTRVGLDRKDHYRVYEWTLEGAELHAQDLGEVCLDLRAEPPDYGRC